MLISFILHGNKTPVSVVDIQSATKFNAIFSDGFIDLINEWSIWKKMSTVKSLIWDAP